MSLSRQLRPDPERPGQAFYPWCVTDGAWKSCLNTSTVSPPHLSPPKVPSAGKERGAVCCHLSCWDRGCLFGGLEMRAGRGIRRPALHLEQPQGVTASPESKSLTLQDEGFQGTHTPGSVPHFCSFSLCKTRNTKPILPSTQQLGRTQTAHLSPAQTQRALNPVPCPQAPTRQSFISGQVVGVNLR